MQVDATVGGDGRAASETIRVLHVLPFVLAGGVERRRILLADHLGAPFEQQIACLTARGPVYEELKKRGVPIHPLGRRGVGITRDPRAHLRLHRLVRAWRPHILHGAIFEGMVWGGIAGLLHRVPVVLLEETSTPDETAPEGMRRSRKARALIRFIANRSDGIVAVAPRVADYLRGPQGIDPSHVHSVMNGVADFPLAPREEALAERRRLGLSDDSFVIGTVGRVHEKHKRISDFLEAVRRLRARYDVRGIVVGDGQDLEPLREKARALGVGEHVVFTGRREDRGLFFAMMDAFVLSAATEAAPLALIEAMMAGRPCVATTVGGVPDIAVDGESALLIPPYRPDLIEARVQRFIEDAVFREKMARGARERAASGFGAQRYAADVRALYVERLRRLGIRHLR